MCGFLVFASKSKKILNFDRVKILNSQRHRGPDKKNFFETDNVYFFHNRLKIIDLSNNANQPFISKETGNVIVFNGEIYNFQALKRKLKNTNFKSESDTEVLLYLYEKYGDNFVELLNGMFSIVIYNKKKNKIFSARDRFGIKPLYINHNKDGVIYSTEVKSIILINKEIGLDYLEIKKYIATGLLYLNQETFFKNVYIHQKSYFYNFSLRSFSFISKSQYWKLKKYKNLVCKNFDSFYEKFLNKFKNALQLNLVSDVEVGLLYSSGTDSNFIKNFIELNFKKKIKTFTYGWNNKKYDEISRLRKLDYNFKDNKNITLNSNQVIKKLKDIIYKCEGPIGGFGTVGIFHLMKVVKKNKIKVLLSGEGGDEFLMGYLNLQIIFLKDLYNLNKNRFHIELKKFNYNNNYNFKTASEFLIFSNKFLNSEIFTPDAQRMSDYNLITYSNAIKNKDVEAKKYKSLSSVVKNYAFKVKLPKLLTFLDKCSGSFGVESRVPMLDHEFVNFLYSNKDSFKFYNGLSKYPIMTWFKNNNIKHFPSKLNVATEQREFFKNIKNYKKIIATIKNGQLCKLKIIKFNIFEKKYKQFINSKELGNSFFIWKILNAEYFVQLFKKNSEVFNNKGFI
jgi:asparagine synthase (glutamine-hydrolysing)